MARSSEEILTYKQYRQYTPDEHYRIAEAMMKKMEEAIDRSLFTFDQTMSWCARAQLHATLATATVKADRQ
jgi:hypothetical protein